jgi:hypothetical protein
MPVTQKQGTSPSTKLVIAKPLVPSDPAGGGGGGGALGAAGTASPIRNCQLHRAH